jgi:hypothetical protein
MVYSDNVYLLGKNIISLKTALLDASKHREN